MSTCCEPYTFEQVHYYYYFFFFDLFLRVSMVTQNSIPLLQIYLMQLLLSLLLLQISLLQSLQSLLLLPQVYLLQLFLLLLQIYLLQLLLLLLQIYLLQSSCCCRFTSCSCSFCFRGCIIFVETKGGFKAAGFSVETWNKAVLPSSG